MAAVLATFGTAVLVEGLAGLHTDVVILAVVLAVTLGRREAAHSDRGRVDRIVALLVLPVVAVGAMQVGTLLVQHPDIGDALFVIAVSAAIWLRRFGPRYARAGSLLALPFIALLITPVPSLPGSNAHAHQLWSALMALIAMGWVTAAHSLDRRLRREHDAGDQPNTRAAGTTNARKLPASTRMAVQMAAALAAAFVVGRWLYPGHWSWLVITAYIVGSGNRGRGDVVHKSLLRLVGAAGGTIVATLVAGLFPAGDKTSIVIIFVVLGVASWLRTFNYAFWAAGMTSVLALLNGYFGESGTHLLDERLAGIAIGAAIAVLSAWFILPVRTTDVVRRRFADVLAALTDYLTTARRSPLELSRAATGLSHAFDLLEQVKPALVAHRRLPRLLRGDEPHAADAVRDLLAYRKPLDQLTLHLTAQGGRPLDPVRLKRFQQQVIEIRRGMRGNPQLPAVGPFPLAAQLAEQSKQLQVDPDEADQQPVSGTPGLAARGTGSDRPLDVVEVEDELQARDHQDGQAEEDAQRAGAVDDRQVAARGQAEHQVDEAERDDTHEGGVDDPAHPRGRAEAMATVEHQHHDEDHGGAEQRLDDDALELVFVEPADHPHRDALQGREEDHQRRVDHPPESDE